MIIHSPSQSLAEAETSGMYFPIWKTPRPISSPFPRACWFMAIELGVSSIPVSEVSPRLSG
jgi:hypothetical protein